MTKTGMGIGLLIVAWLAAWYFLSRKKEEEVAAVAEDGLWTPEEEEASLANVKASLPETPVVADVISASSESQAIAAIQRDTGLEDITDLYRDYTGKIKPNCDGLYGEAFTACMMERLKIQAAEGELLGTATAIHLAQLQAGAPYETVRQIIERLKVEAREDPTSEAAGVLRSEKEKIALELERENKAYTQTWVGLVETQVPKTPVEAMGRGYSKEEAFAMFSERETAALTEIGYYPVGSAKYQELTAIIREERAKREAQA